MAEYNGGNFMRLDIMQPKYQKFNAFTEQQLSDIKNPDVHLTCYKVKPRGADLGHDRIKFDTNNQFGPEFLKTKLHDELDRNEKIQRHNFCVPTQKFLTPG